MENSWQTLNEHRAIIDTQVVKWEAKHQSEVPPELQALYLALRLILNTKHSGVSKSQFKPMVSGDGWEYPNPTNFDETIWHEIERIAKSTQDCRLRAHLADLCWSLNTRHQVVDLAIEGYRATYKTVDSVSSTANRRINQLISMYRALELSKAAGRKELHAEILEDIVSLMTDTVSSDDLQLNGWNLDLFRLAQARLSHFTATQKEQIFDLAVSLKEKGTGNEYLTFGALEICRDLARSLSRESDLVEIHEQLVHHWLEGASEGDPSAIGASDRLRKAIILIRELPKEHSLKTKLAELELARQRLLLDDNQYSTISHEMDLDTRFINDFLETVELSIGKEPLALPCFLITAAPTSESLKNQLIEHKQETPFLHAISHQPVWGDGVMEAVLESEEEKDAYFITQNLNGFARIMSVYLVGLSMRESVDFELEPMIELIRNSALLDSSRQETIEAGIEAFFNQKYRLAASLIAMEFEPAVRYLYSAMGWNYLVSDPSGAQRTIQLDEMLTDERMKTILPESWLLMTKALLLDEGGSKLRHRVAHGRDISDLSNREFVTLLLSLFLWLANMRIIDGTPEDSSCEENPPK